MSELSQQNVDRFNQLAAEWDDSPRRTELARAVAEAIRQAVQPNGHESVLEFGCGTGLLTAALSSHVGRILAVDSAEQMLETLAIKLRNLNIDNVETRLGSVPDPLPHGEFDLIVSSMTLHHVEDTAAVMESLFSRLCPGGRIALADLDAEDGSFHGDKPGIAHHGFERNALGTLISNIGFKDVAFTDAHRMEKETDSGETQAFSVFLLSAVRPA